MKKNLHPVEKTIRIFLGLFLLSLIVWGPKSLWGLLGLIPLVTGLVSLCPLYSIFGFSTCCVKKPEEKEEESSPEVKEEVSSPEEKEEVSSPEEKKEESNPENTG